VLFSKIVAADPRNISETRDVLTIFLNGLYNLQTLINYEIWFFIDYLMTGKNISGFCEKKFIAIFNPVGTIMTDSWFRFNESLNCDMPFKVR